ncbi:MAG: hypothetical protein IT319_10590 [Anaerolineae bacterium]|nr:hypothetical protein [Anaerolineae bacterium]
MSDRPARAYRYDIVIAAPNSALDSYYPMPALVVGEINRAVAGHHTAGGKGFNMARAAVSLGGRTMSIGIVAGSSGEFIVSELAREGIPAEVIWGERETRRTATMPVAELRQSTGILEPGVPSGARARDAFTEMVLRCADLAPFVTLTGSLPPDFPVDYYASLIAQLKTRSAVVALDASGDVLRLAAQAGPSILKVNIEELDSAFGNGADGQTDIVERGQRAFFALHPLGLEYLIVTDGSRGAYIFKHKHELLHVVTPLESWACPAGAGDSFMAGLLLALGRGDALEEAVAQASAAAAASIHHIVAGQIELALFKRLKLRTRVQRITVGSLR